MSPSQNAPEQKSTRGKSVLLFVLVAALALISDLLTKAWVFSHWQLGDQEVLIEDWLSITPILNPGVAFGGFPGGATVLLYGLPVLLLLILAYAWKMRHEGAAVVFLMGCIFGGALGNYYDRLTVGKVRDFVDVRFGDWYDYPVFNLADAYISCSVAGLLLLQLLHSRKRLVD